MRQAAGPRIVRFGEFVVDARGRTLCRGGLRLKLHRQSFEILLLLLEHPGEVVPREELQRKLWSGNTFVDFENSLNAVVKKLRHALGDCPDQPRYVETVPRVGYRFIAPVESLDGVLPHNAKPTLKRLRELAPMGVLEDPAALGPEVASPSSRAIETSRSVAFPPNKPFAALLKVVAAIALVILALTSRHLAPPPRVLRIRQITHLGTVEAQQTLVTDGPRVYFRDHTGGKRSLKYVSTEGGDAFLLPNSSPGFDIDGISPDGANLLVISAGVEADNPLWMLPTDGGSPRRLGNTMATDASWSADGHKLAFMNAENALHIANADGTEPRKLADVAGFPFCPRWSPDSSHLRFAVIHSGTGPIDLWDLATNGKSDARPLLPGWHRGQREWGGAWSTDGRYFFFSSTLQDVNCIWALRQKADWWHKLSRWPVQLTAGPISYSLPAMSRDGKALFVVGEQRRGELLRYDLRKRTIRPFLPNFSGDHVSFSRDGQWITYVQYPEGTLWRSKADGTDRLQLTQSPLHVYAPRWSPDGEWIAFVGVANTGQPLKVYTVSADGEQPPKQLATEGAVDRFLDWSPDGNAIAFESSVSKRAPETSAIAILDLRTKKLDLLPGSQDLAQPQWSPDGRCIIARGDSKTLMLYDFKKAQWSDMGVKDADYPAWSRDGQYIYFNTFYSGPDRSIFELRVADRRLRKLVTLNDFTPAGIYGYWSGIAPDGSALFLRDASSRDIYAIDLDLP